MWTHRQARILELICKNPNGIKGTEIAGILNVSARTVRNDIVQLNEALKKSGCAVSSSNSAGYFLKAEHLPIAVSLVQSHEAAGSGDEAADRRYRLAGEILFGGPQHLDDLAEKLFVSSQTVYKDLQRLQRELGDEAFLISRDIVSAGQGEEAARRCFLLLLKEEAVRRLLPERTRLVEVLGPHYDAAQFKALTGLVRDKFLEQNLVLSDVSLFLVVWAVYFSAKRSQMGCRLPALGRELRTDRKISGILRELVDVVEGFGEADIGFLDHFMWTLKLFDSSGGDADEVCRTVFEAFCEETRRAYGLDLLEDGDLAQRLADHIDYMLRRLREGYEMDNPGKGLIREKYAFAYEIAMLIVPIVFRCCGRYLIDGEVSYLAVYVEYYLEDASRAVRAVLASGFRSSMTELARRWIATRFPHRLEILDAVPLNQLDACLSGPGRGAELVISLAEAPPDRGLPVCVISELPGEEDHKQITEAMNKVLVGRRFEIAVNRRFSPELVLVEREPRTFEEVIRILSGMLLAAGNIGDAEAFAKDVLEREVNYPTFLSGSFMIPHPLTAFASKTAVAAAILKKPARHRDRNVRMIFLLAIEAKLDPEVSDLFQLFKLIAPDKNACERLAACEDAQAFLKELSAVSLAAYRNM